MRRLHFSTPVNIAHTLNRDLVSWWINLPGGVRGGGLTFHDLMRRNNGALTGMDGGNWRGAGRPGGHGSLDFETDDHVLGDTTLGTSLSPCTIVLWFRQDTRNSSGPMAFQRIVDFADGDDQVQIAIPNNVNDEICTKHDLYQTGNDGLSWGQPSLGVWHHLVATFDTAASASTCYLDGVALSSAATTNIGATSDENKFTIGIRRDLHSGTYFDGAVDDIRLYNSVWSPMKVAWDFDESRSGHPRTLNWDRSYRVKYTEAVGGGASRYLVDGSLAGYNPLVDGGLAA